MKKLFLCAALAALLAGCSSAPAGMVKYNIKGDVPDLEEDRVYLIVEKDTVDSADVVDGRFAMEGFVPVYSIGSLVSGSQFAVVLFEKGRIRVEGERTSGQPIAVTGTRSNDTYTDLQRYAVDAQRQFYTSDPATMNQDSLIGAFQSYMQDTYNNNVGTLFGAYALANQIRYQMTPDEIFEEIRKYPDEMRSAPVLLDLEKELDAAARTDTGRKFIEITMPDRDGNPVSLSGQVGEGRYVLVDFWASWCVPCLEEMPYLKQAYELYHGRGFEIFGVSLDDSAADWTAAIDDGQLPWIHVLAPEGGMNATAIDYGVDMIPANFLIGPDGKIVVKNLRGADLVNYMGRVYAAEQH